MERMTLRRPATWLLPPAAAVGVVGEEEDVVWGLRNFKSSAPPARFCSLPAAPGKISPRSCSSIRRWKRGQRERGRRCAVGEIDESEAMSAAGDSRRQRWESLQVLSEGDRCYKIVRSLFLTGMRRFSPHTRITRIRRGLRLKAFMAQAERTKLAGGAANIKFGWYGADASAVAAVAADGFGSLIPGAFLSHASYPYPSSLLSEVDEDGERHIMGFVWGAQMNTNILPQYIVSFKTSDPQRPMTKGAKGEAVNRGLSFPKLFAEMGSSLPSSRVQALQVLYNRFKAGRVSKDIFTAGLRRIVGDRLLRRRLSDVMAANNDASIKGGPVVLLVL
ncbi:unnamed protein product [Spirodela intermedia]|uniref:RST domain-containing protein n=1 Tax=Spirodela intermedia TaxID=51605 RepID=A0A7I8IID8_SPIIN|nr:unnamed protein product [Spirodela intermedia]CAA6657635.1 unnamed protein product [Spirodela intermedia]